MAHDQDQKRDSRFGRSREIGTDHVKRRASKRATARHIKCVCGNPCSKRTAGPDPKRRRKIPVSSARNSIASKSSNVVAFVITRPPIERLFLKCRAYSDPCLPQCIMALMARSRHVGGDGRGYSKKCP